MALVAYHAVADGDGDADLFVGNNGQKNALYLNDGKGKLVAAASSAATAGSEYTTSVAWADADGDGDPDLFVGNNAQKSALYLNDGKGKLSAAASSAATAGARAKWPISISIYFCLLFANEVIAHIQILCRDLFCLVNS